MKKIALLFATLGAFALGSSSEPIEEEVSSVAEESSIIAEESLPEAIEEEDETKKAIDNFINEYFSGDKIAMYFSWLAYLATIIGLVKKLISLKKSNNLTLENVNKLVQASVSKNVSEAVSEKFKEFAPSLVSGQEKTNEVLTIFAKILALSQENTPESKVAILNLIGELGVAGKELVETAKEIVEEGVKVEKEAEEKLNEQLDGIIEQYDGTSI